MSASATAPEGAPLEATLVADAPGDAGAAAASSPVAAGPPAETCTYCGAEKKDKTSPWCRRCGYYPLIGQCVELADDEKDVDTTPEGEPIVPAKAPEPTALEGLLYVARHVPPWVWKVLAGVLVVVAISLIGRFTTRANTTPRIIWVIAQAAIGFFVMAGAHIWSFLRASTESDKFGPIDLFVRPLEIWKTTWLEMKTIPSTWWRIGAWFWGFTAKTLAFAAIGGVPYDKIWEYGPKAPPKRDLIQSIVDEANRGAKDAESLEEAMAQLEKEPPKEEIKRQPIDCVIIGFLPEINQPNTPRALLVAAVVDSKLRYIGAVSEGISPEERERLEVRLPQIIRKAPFLPCSEPGTWVEPIVAVRVRFVDFDKQRLISDPRFEKILAEINLAKESTNLKSDLTSPPKKSGGRK